MGRKMNNAPVYFTICQVRFNTILQLMQYVPEIQEKMRKSGFADFAKREDTTINFGTVVGEQSVTPKVEVVERFLFSNMKRTAGFFLEHNGLSFQVSEYETFEKFCEQFLLGLSELHDVVGLNFTERVGIRYLDVVIPKPGEKASAYLVREVHGLSGSLDRHAHRHTYSETVANSDAGSITARVVIKSGKVGLASDLGPPTVQLPSRVTHVNGEHAIIDTDGAVNIREEFSLGGIKTRLEALHLEISKVFKSTVTEHALKVWD